MNAAGAVDFDAAVKSGRRWLVPVTCPECRQPRRARLDLIKMSMDKGGFTGRCRRCHVKASVRWALGRTG